MKRPEETASLLIFALRNIQGDLTDESRKALWLRLQQGYCERCARETEWVCHCENDE